MIGEGFAAVLAAAQGGSEEAFSRLWRDGNPPLLRYLRVIAPEVAEDVAADTWVQVVRGLAGFRGDEQAWRALSAAAARKRRRGLKVTLGFIGGIIALIVIGAASSAIGGSNSGTSSGTGTAAGTGTGTGNGSAAPIPGASEPGIGDKVRDGKFELSPGSAMPGASAILSSGSARRRRAGSLIVSLRVTNIGSESQTLDVSAQVVFDVSGRKFSADGAADIDLGGASGQNSTWLEDFNPGNTVHGRIAFDMPAGDTAAKIELHDSIFPKVSRSA